MSLVDEHFSCTWAVKMAVSAVEAVAVALLISFAILW